MIKCDWTYYSVMVGWGYFIYIKSTVYCFGRGILFFDILKSIMIYLYTHFRPCHCPQRYAFILYMYNVKCVLCVCLNYALCDRP